MLEILFFNIIIWISWVNYLFPFWDSKTCFARITTAWFCHHLERTSLVYWRQWVNICCWFCPVQFVFSGIAWGAAAGRAELIKLLFTSTDARYVACAQEQMLLTKLSVAHRITDLEKIKGQFLEKTRSTKLSSHKNCLRIMD